MTREIKFRGKSVDKGEWVFGSLLISTDKIYHAILNDIEDEPLHQTQVIRESVGQFTGLKDKNGKEIFEGDIVRGVGVTSYDKPIIRRVVYDDKNARFGLADVKGNITFEPLVWISFPLEIIGNIHENPELLK